MAIQIHQLNELTPSVSDYLALDTGADTGKASVSALADAMLADYEATFGTGDTATVIDKVNGKVNKAGDTMTGNLVISGSGTEQRLLRIQNGTRNVRTILNGDGNFGFYDDTNSGWILRSSSGNGLLTTPTAFSTGGNMTVGGLLTVQGHSSAVGTIVQASKATATAITGGSWVELQRIAIPAGTWAIVGNVTCSTTTSSADASKFFTVRLNTSDGYARMTVPLVSGVSSGSVADFYEDTAPNDMVLSVYSGINANIARSYLKAVRIA